LSRTPFPGFATGITIVSVFRNTNPAASFGPAGCSLSWEGHPAYRIGAQAVFGNSVTEGWGDLATKTAPTLHVFRARLVANFNINASDRFDGVNGAAFTPLPYGFPAEDGKWFTIGMRSDGGAFFGGDVGTVILYDREVPDAELLPLEASLRAHWGTP